VKRTHDTKIHLHFHAVTNYRAAADESENCCAVLCDWDGKFVP